MSRANRSALCDQECRPLVENRLKDRRMFSRSQIAYAAVAAVLLAGCGSDDDAPSGPSGESPPETALVASKLAVLSIATATAREGRSFFDNFLSCPRRGVVNYHNTTAGRRAT